MKIKKLIEQAKELNGFTTDQELCQKLGVSHGTVHHWKNEMSVPKPVYIQMLAELANEDPAPLLIESLKTSNQHTGLHRTLDRLKRIATAALTTLPGLLLAIEKCILCKIKPHSGKHQPAMIY